MIVCVTGDLLRADVEALVNPVNTRGVMGKGLALQFKRAHPANFRRYRQACDAGALTVGTVFTYDAGPAARPRYVVNVPTKDDWRAPSTIAIVQAGLDALVAEVVRLGVGSLAVPPLGCGLGGLAWEDVRPRIDEAFARVPTVRVLLYVP